MEPTNELLTMESLQSEYSQADDYSASELSCNVESTSSFCLPLRQQNATTREITAVQSDGSSRESSSDDSTSDSEVGNFGSFGTFPDYSQSYSQDPIQMVCPSFAMSEVQQETEKDRGVIHAVIPEIKEDVESGMRGKSDDLDSVVVKKSINRKGNRKLAIAILTFLVLGATCIVLLTLLSTEKKNATDISGNPVPPSTPDVLPVSPTAAPAAEMCAIFLLIAEFGLHGAETTWEIIDTNSNSAVTSGGPYLHGKNITERACLSVGSYQFIMKSMPSDGGQYMILLGDQVLRSTPNGESKADEVTSFTITENDTTTSLGSFPSSTSPEGPYAPTLVLMPSQMPTEIPTGEIFVIYPANMNFPTLMPDSTLLPSREYEISLRTTRPTTSPTEMAESLISPPTKNPSSNPTGVPTSLPSEDSTNVPSENLTSSPTLVPTLSFGPTATTNPLLTPQSTNISLNETVNEPQVNSTVTATISNEISSTNATISNPQTYSPTTYSPTTIHPTYVPTYSPSNDPTQIPSQSQSPTQPPSVDPTESPTRAPTLSPTKRRTFSPSTSPTAHPTVPLFPNSLGEICHNVTVIIKTDFKTGRNEKKDEVTWELRHASGNAVMSGGPLSSGRTYIKHQCLQESVYTLNIQDSGGNGFGQKCDDCGYFVYVNGVFVGGSVAFYDNEELTFPVPGYGNEPNGSRKAKFCTEDFYVAVTTDNWPREISWELTEQNGKALLSGGKYDAPFSTYTHRSCLPPGRVFNFTIVDNEGDGIEGGYYVVYAGGEALIDGDDGSANFGLSKTTIFEFGPSM